MTRNVIFALFFGLCGVWNVSAQSVTTSKAAPAKGYHVTVKQEDDKKGPTASYLVCDPISITRKSVLSTGDVTLRECDKNCTKGPGGEPFDKPFRVSKPFVLEVTLDSAYNLDLSAKEEDHATVTAVSGSPVVVPDSQGKPVKRYQYIVNPLKTGQLQLTATPKVPKTNSDPSSSDPSHTKELPGDVQDVCADARRKLRELPPSFSPVVITLYVDAQWPNSDPSSCARLFSKDPSQASGMDAPSIVKFLGSPDPFSLSAAGNDSILIYSTKAPEELGQEKKALKHLIDRIYEISQVSPKDLGVKPPESDPLTIELTLPHAAALSSLPSRIASLNSPFKVVTVGSDTIQVTGKKDCKSWISFLSDLQHLAQGVRSEPLTARMFYLSNGPSVTGSGASTALNATGPATASPGGNGSGGTGQGSGGSKDSSGGGSAGSSGAPSATAPAPPPAPPVTSVNPVDQDMLVFTDPSPGDDAAVVEKKRILAQLDIPRPEMIINAWVMQGSSKYPEVVGAFSDIVRRTATQFNDRLESSVMSAWGYLRGEISTAQGSADLNVPGFFEPHFYKYIAWRYVGELPFSGAPAETPDKEAQRILDGYSNATVKDDVRENLGICPHDEYCLGYGAIFQPLKPRLTDLLITVIAAKCPIEKMMRAIDYLECPGGNCSAPPPSGSYFEVPKVRERLGLDAQPGDFRYHHDCRRADLEMAAENTQQGESPQRMPFECFRQKANVLFQDTPDDGGSRNTVTPSYVGSLRAAIADFLFQYKMSQQYTHEFVPYDLNQSADALNSAFSPLVDAFNEDVQAFQQFLLARLDDEVGRLPRGQGLFHDLLHKEQITKALFGAEDNSFFNDGIVSVRVISGQNATVSATAQSVLDASSAPNISDLAGAITGTGATPQPSSTSPAKPLGVLGNLSFNQAQVIMAAIQAFQTTKVQIGSQLTLNVNPRSLSTASAAEIQVTLNADQPGDPNFYGGPKGAANPDLPRISHHDTSTKVRVDSIKLFEVSSFAAEVQRGRSRFPLLPPFVEIPYIGTVIGFPLPPAKQYHSSIAVLSALVVPTAADLAYGLRFKGDRVLLGSANGRPCTTLIAGSSKAGESENVCRQQPAISLHDFGDKPIREFNEAKTRCFATGGGLYGYNLRTTPDNGTWSCDNLNFDSVTRDGH